MQSGPSRLLASLACALAALTARNGEAQAQPQAATPMRALELEQAGKYREAVVAYREALAEGSLIPSVLGLERAYSLLGQSDSILPLIDSIILRRPRDPMLRTVQLRTLHGLRRDAEASRAFEQWLLLSPRDATPYREYARLLLDDSRAAAADTVLQRAQRVLGSARDFTLELAQLRAAMGLWEPSATSWREAMRTAPYLEQAAVFALIPAPATARPGIRAILLAPPAEIGARRILGMLELRWRSARDGWKALAELPPSDSTVLAWIEFAEQAEQSEEWLSARDALAAALGQKQSPQLAVRAATDALSGGDPASAIDLLQRSGAARDPARTAEVLPLLARALSDLGRAGEAEALLAERGALVEPDLRGRVMRTIAWGWVRAGDLARAKAALAASPAGEDDRTSGWIALYEGDLATARRGLRRAVETSPDLVLALALLARTRADSSAAIGAAFLALTRGDSVGAAARFESAAKEISDGAPLLVAAAARIHTVRREDARGVPLWQAIVERYPSSPEAAEADLEWARALRRDGRNADAVQRLEHLILTYPQSALVPQARRELEIARGTAPTP